jgi:hypothetical protein
MTASDETVSGCPRVEIAARKRIAGFMGLLAGSGFTVRVAAGCSVREFLCDRLGIRRGYLDDRIQTIFLNGKAVDDTETARVQGGDTLTLSAAMPGLVGATFRKGGYYAPMRREISHSHANGNAGSSAFPVIKLLNLVQKELSPSFFERGILLATEVLAGFAAIHLDLLEGGIVSVTVDGVPKAAGSLPSLENAYREILLIVTFV